MSNNKKSILRAIIAAIIGFGTVLILSIAVGNKSIQNLLNTNDSIPKTIIDNKSRVDSSVTKNKENVVKPSPLDSLLKERQTLEDSFLREVRGTDSGKAGYGSRAKAIQKQLEEVEKEIEILQKYGITVEAPDNSSVAMKIPFSE
jgi:hypothetical protein